MRFEQAVRYLRRGKCIRRSAWSPLCHIEHSQGEHIRHYNGRRWQSFIMIMRDLFDEEGNHRDDWEVIR